VSPSIRIAPATIDPADIADHARDADARRRMIAGLEQLDNDDVDLGRLDRLRASLPDQPILDADRVTDRWLDNAILAHAASELLLPRRALEIGVRRGFASCAIVTGNPLVELHLMDSWRPVYSDRPNPGPVLLREQLQFVGHRGNATFHHGNSHMLLPQLFQRDPSLTFDLVVVDGDHTEAGADADLRDVFPHVSHGGIVIFDDLTHPQHRYLLDLWHRWRDRLAGQFEFAEYLDDGLGVGWAIRRR
jgi:predicted O-methyltransferase YrrM